MNTFNSQYKKTFDQNINKNSDLNIYEDIRENISSKNNENTSKTILQKILDIPSTIKFLLLFILSVVVLGVSIILVSNTINRIGEIAVTKSELQYVLLYPNNVNDSYKQTYFADKLPQSLSVRDRQNPINGELYTQDELNKFINSRPISIVIDNQPLARPQSGLSKADIVYESLVEGGITRLLAIYWSKDVDKVGPVRSARTYFADIANEYDSIFSHYGQASKDKDSYLTYRTISGDKIDMNSYYSNFSTRNTECGVTFDSSLQALGISIEHTGFTSAEAIKKCIPSSYIGKANIKSWKFKNDELISKRPQSNQVKISFNKNSDSDYVSTWLYNKDTNSYKRFVNNQVTKDKLNQQDIEAKTIIIQRVKVAETLDSKNRIYNELIGEGTGQVVMDGKIKNIDWRRITTYDRTEFFEKNGTPLELNRGKIWVLIIPDIQSGDATVISN